MIRRQVLTLLPLLCLASCHRPVAKTLPTLAAGQAFVAFERDFEDFRDWQRVPVPERGRAQGITHTAGLRREWINAKPAKGSTTFAVGTILVKEIDSGMPEGHQLFAMVKRGAGYNHEGAKGWEWFELFERKTGGLGIQWRGINAPVGESYGSGDPMGGCNGCHETATGNDYVKAEAAALSALGN